MNTTEFFEKLKFESFSELGEKSGLSRRALYDALKSQNMKLSNLSSVAASLDLEVQLVPSESEDNLLMSLRRFGGPVTHESGGNLTLEAALAAGLKLSRNDGYYESVLPYVLAMNADQLDTQKLMGLTLLEDQVNVLGYYGELAQAFKPHSKLKLLLKRLEAFKKKETTTLLQNEKVNFPELFQRNHLALKWNLLTRGTEQDHLERYKKWRELRKSSSKYSLQKSMKNSKEA